MDKKVMNKLEEGFCEVLHSYAEKGFQKPEQVETAKAALSGLVKMKMLEEMENFHKEDGYSGRMYRDDGDMSSRSYGRDSMGRYADNGGSYRGYHDDGYSGHDKMISQLEKMRETANPNDRRMIDEWMNRLNQR